MRSVGGLSAFGVEHGGVSKGVPRGLGKVAGKLRIKPGVEPINPQHMYAARRLAAHQAGRTAAAHPKLLNSDLQRGYRSRLDSRDIAQALTPTKAAPPVRLKPRTAAQPGRKQAA